MSKSILKQPSEATVSKHVHFSLRIQIASFFRNFLHVLIGKPYHRVIGGKMPQNQDKIKGGMSSVQAIERGRGKAIAKANIQGRTPILNAYHAHQIASFNSEIDVDQRSVFYQAPY